MSARIHHVALSCWLILVAVAGVDAAALVQDRTPTAAEPLQFEVASIRPNTGADLSIRNQPPPPDGLRLMNYPLAMISRYAYGVQVFRVSGTPAWANTTRFDIDAKAAGVITEDERRLMLRALLAERFQLRARFEPREQNAYVLTAARPDQGVGPGLTARPECATTTCQTGGTFNLARGVAQMRAMTVGDIARGMLSNTLGQVVYDESGISGRFDMELSWRPDTVTDPNDNRASLFTAVQEQLGLKLTAQRRAVDMLVIESVQLPSAN